MTSTVPDIGHRRLATGQPQGTPNTRPPERPRRVVDIPPDDDAECCCKCGIHRAVLCAWCEATVTVPAGAARWGIEATTGWKV